MLLSNTSRRGAASGGGGSTDFLEDTFVPTLGQVSFILSQAPTDLEGFEFLVNGVEYRRGDDFTLSGVTITWSNFQLDSSDVVVVRYV